MVYHKFLALPSFLVLVPIIGFSNSSSKGKENFFSDSERCGKAPFALPGVPSLNCTPVKGFKWGKRTPDICVRHPPIVPETLNSGLKTVRLLGLTSAQPSQFEAIVMVTSSTKTASCTGH